MGGKDCGAILRDLPSDGRCKWVNHFALRIMNEDYYDDETKYNLDYDEEQEERALIDGQTN